MVKSLEQFVAEATQAYAPAKQAVQTQLGGLQGQLDTANTQINKNYEQQQANLNRQRNMAASQASMQAAGSGGSFGGAANIANRKYYAQQFTPAVTQMQTNQANDLAQARQNYENQRTNLNAQLANLDATANQQALQQYWAAVEAEKQRQAQLAANSAQNAYYQAMMDQMKNPNNATPKVDPNMTFLDYLYSDAYNNSLPSDISNAERAANAQRMAAQYNDLMRNVEFAQGKLNDGNAAVRQAAQKALVNLNNQLRNIYNGSVYQSYLKAIGGNK